jgi:hypothetical protein
MCVNLYIFGGCICGGGYMWNNGCNIVRVKTMKYEGNLMFTLLLEGILLSFDL